jgi:hypothetical protein
MAYKDLEKIRKTNKDWNKRNRERVAATTKAWRERNREREAATAKAWRERNRERKAATTKAWRERNRERKAATTKAWSERNRERKAEKNKAWRERNPERVAAIAKAWRERNRDLINEKNRRRRCKEKNSSVPLTANEKKKILLMERARQQLQKETGLKYHIDHILPIVHGGIHHPVNLMILDSRENGCKRDKLLPEAIALAPEHFRLYSERISTERAWEFVRQLAAGLGLGEDDLDALVTGKPLKRKPTLEDFMA